MSAAAGALSLLPAHLAAAAEGTAIRPFRVNVPEADLVDLRRRVLATRWPAKETVTINPRAYSWRSSRAYPLLGDGLRLAERGEEVECLADVRD